MEQRRRIPPRETSLHCPVCRSVEIGPNGEIATCRHCSHMFQHPARITVEYGLAYIEKYFLRPEQAMSHLRVGFIKAFIDKGRLLDVGYGTGAFVQAALAAGFDAYGTDIHGLDHGVRERPLQSAENWDVLTFFDSLEHFPDLSVAREVCERSAVVVISTPMPPRTFPTDRKWRHYKPGEHLHYFSPQSLSALLHPKVCASLSDVEDAVRGKIEGRQNIMTMVFR